ncbi:MAG: uracil-DNA glycosylase [Victivallales bacterium]|nr:uracil-DNA glycosylase [Victivallales bacterium]
MAEHNFFNDMEQVLKNCRDHAPCAFLSSANRDAFFAPAPRESPLPPATAAIGRKSPPPDLSRPTPEHVPEISPAAVPASPPAVTADPAAMNLEELAAAAQHCTACRLHAERHHVVFGEGAPDAELMFIGEGPGFDEDRIGRPFVGKAGQLLDKMIAAMQFTREEVFIANIVKCRPPGNRNPQPDEAAACLPFLQRQIELIRPRVIVLLGAVPLEHLLHQRGIRRLRGQWQEYHGIPVMPTYHPAYLLRFPEGKREAWDDLQRVMKVFGKVYSR